MSADPYSVLGVSRNADEETIRQAYRRLAKKYHPDLNPGDAAAAQKMNEVNAAYEQIKNPQAYQQQARSQYQQQSRTQYQQNTYYDPFGFNGYQGSSQQNGSADPFREFYETWYRDAQRRTSDTNEEGYHWTYRRSRRPRSLLLRILGVYFAIQILFSLLSGCGYRRYYPRYYEDYPGREYSGYSDSWEKTSPHSKGSIQ